MKKIIISNEKGSIPWKWLTGLVAVAGLIAVAIPFIPPKAPPVPAPVTVRGKIPASPSVAPASPVRAADPAPAPADRQNAIYSTAAQAQQAADTGSNRSEGAPGHVAPAEPPHDSGPTADAVRDAGALPAREVKPVGHEPPEPGAPQAPVPAAAREGGVRAANEPSPAAASRIAAARQAAPAKAPHDPSLAPVKPFSIQVGAYRNKAYADVMVARLHKRGYRPFVFIIANRRGDWHTVRFGRFANRVDADAALRSFRKKEKMEAVVVRSGPR